MNRTKIDYGIDLGTTHSAIARMVKGEPKIIKSDMLKDTMPSCVHYNKRGDCLVGDKAIAVLKNDHMRAMKSFNKHETNTFIEFKRTMGKDTKYPCPNLNRELTSEELSAEVLKRLKSSVLDENISSVVITVPAKFTALQCEATIQAAKMAGFNEKVILLREPIAAIIASCGLEPEKKEGYWLVFDFGESAFDAALIRAQEGVMQIMDTDDDSFLGGKNLDEAIVDQIILPYLKETYCIDSILNDPDKREILREGVKRYAEDAKIQMSFKESTTILTNYPGEISFEDEFGCEIDVDILVTQEDMERVTAPIFQKAIEITKELLSRNNLRGNQLDVLILVGGPTHSPILRRMLKEQITENVDTSVDPMTAVALGAALFASTVDIYPPPPPPPKIVLELKYPSQCYNETSEMVSIKVLKDKSGNLPEKIFVELKRADGAWSNIKQVNDKKATIFDVELEPEKANFFEICVMDAQANLLKCEQEGFTIIPVVLPTAPLSYKIPEDTTKLSSTDYNEIVLDLKYPTQTVDTSELVAIKELKDESERSSVPYEMFVELKRSDGLYSVKKQVNNIKATIFNVELVPEKVNFFEIYVISVTEGIGTIQHKCKQEGFTIIHGVPTVALLPYHIGIAKYSEDLFYPVKGLEQNRELSATGVIKMKTNSTIEKGNDSHKCRIPIYQGDYDAVGTKLSPNHLIHEIIITGKNFPGTLRIYSIVDITIKVDESQRMYFTAYFPDLDYSEEMEIKIKQEKLPSVKELTENIAKAKLRAQKANWNDLVQQLDKLDEQLKYKASSNDNRLTIQDGIRKILIQLIAWENVENKLNEQYNTIEDIRRKKQQIINEKNIKKAKNLIEEIRTLQISLDNEATDGLLYFFVLQKINDNFDSIKWINPILAKLMIAQGIEFANAKKFKAIRPILELVQLIERGGDTQDWKAYLKEIFDKL